MDACDAGCKDVAVGYGTTPSYAKNRFVRRLREEKAAATAVGLWNTSYSDIPDANAVRSACNALFGLADPVDPDSLKMAVDNAVRGIREAGVLAATSEAMRH